MDLRQIPAVELFLFESGGDNPRLDLLGLDMVDSGDVVIDVAGRRMTSRARGRGVMECDLLVFKKIDLAHLCGVRTCARCAEAENAWRRRRPVCRPPTRDPALEWRLGCRCTSRRSPFKG